MRDLRRYLGGLALLGLCAAATGQAATVAHAQAKVNANYGKLPMSFEENRGQSQPQVKLLSQGQGYAMFLTSSGVTMNLQPSAVPSHPDRRAAVRMTFDGAHSPAIAGEDLQSSHTSYFLGKDPAKWVTGVPNYSRVRYRGLYPGVDLLFYGNQRQLEYDWRVSPGADPRAIRLTFDGVDGMHIDAAGNLVLETSSGEILQHKPVVYQPIAGARRAVNGRYVIQPHNRVTFEIARYDRHQPLVIDPVLTFSTYLGYNTSTTVATVTGPFPAVAADSQGNAYLTGFNGGTFPGSPMMFGTTMDVFVAKLNPSGTALVYSAVLGGSGRDVGTSIVVDSMGDAYIAGATTSQDFPLSTGAYQNSIKGNMNAFVAELNPAGNALTYSTYLGGSSSDFASAIGIDGSGNAYVTGTATSTDFPLVHQLTLTPGPGFLTEFNPTGTNLVYSTYISAGIGYGIAVDSTGNAYLAGTTTGTTTTQGYALKVIQSSGIPAIGYGPVKFGNATRQTVAFGIAINSVGAAYVTGMTDDPNFPVTSGAAQTTYGGGDSDAFALKLDAAGHSTPVYATYIGGLGGNAQPGTNALPEAGSGIGLDTNDNAYVAGTTQCIGFPVNNQIAGARNGGPATLFETTDTAANWSATSLAGSFDRVTALAFDSSGNIYAGATAFNASGGGVYKSTDGGSTWSPATTGIDSTSIDAIAVDPITSTTLYAVGSGTIYKTTNGGTSWTALTLGPNQSIGSNATLAIAPSSGASVVYVGSSAGLLYTTNGGSTFILVATVPQAPVTSVIIDPTNHFTAYASTSSGIYKTTNLPTGSWSLANTGVPAGTVHDLAIASNATILYATTDIEFCTSTTAAASWTCNVIPDIAATLNLVAVDTAGKVYVTGLGDGIIVGTTSGGTVNFGSPPVLSFNGLTRNPVLALGIPPGTTGTVFAGIVSATDTFLTQISPDGSMFVSSSCIGGSDNDQGQSIAVTPAGTVYLSGATASTNFPVSAGAVQHSLPAPGQTVGNYDAFVVRVDNSSQLIQVNATLNGTPFGGAVVYQLTGAATLNGTTVPMAYPNQPTGSYTLAYMSGGPPGAVLSSITPSATQTLSAGGGITFTLNFMGSTGGNGTIVVNATLNESPFSGSLTFQLNGPTSQSGTTVPATFLNETPGTYTLAYVSGGPPGASFVSITPSAKQTLAGGMTVTFTINFAQLPNTPLVFVPVTPCRVVDTRNPNGPLGGPRLSNNSRDFPIPTGPCGIPSTAAAYALNVTAVPSGPLYYLTIWPTGLPQPVVSTLNSINGLIKADAAIVPAGTNGSVSVYANGASDVVLDINGYFTSNNSSALAFYPVTPCRLVDTRNPNGPLGGPIMSTGQTRTFPLPTSTCNDIPAGAMAYSLNFTAVPPGPLYYLTAWPTGETQPVVSTLNASSGLITANAAVVPAGTSGDINVYVNNTTHVVIDINGYFAPPGLGGLSFFPAVPCRVLDTRNPNGPLGGPELVGQQARTFPVTGACGLPSTAQAYSFNATVVPALRLGYLELWPAGGPQPVVSTLNSPDGSIDSNAAIVPAGTSGSINAFGSDSTNLILDTNGYFAPAP